MKPLLSIAALAAIGVLGYLAEPSLRFRLTGASSTAVELAQNKKVIIQLPSGAAVDLASLAPEQLPSSVVLKAEVKAFDNAAHITTNFQAGRSVKLIRIEGGNAVVTIDEGSFIGRAPVTETDLFELIAAKLSAGNPTPTETQAAPATAPVAAPVTAAQPETPTPPTVEPETSAAQPATEASSPPEAASAAEPEVPAEPAPPTAAEPTDPVKAMQDSIKAGQIKEFTTDQVQDWKVGDPETINGESYQVGLATYKAVTVFGEKNIQAKALIQSGKVIRWVWPKSGTDIK